jgi:general secretion pathway protein L
VAALLDMDMTTLARLAGEGFAWWTGELRAMLPARLLAMGRSAPAVTARWANGQLTLSRGGNAVALPGAGRSLPVTLDLPAGAALVRTLDLPALGRRDLERMVTLDLDRLMPFPAGTAVAAIEAGARNAAGQVRVTIAAMPRTEAQAALTAADAANLKPVRLSVAGRFDLLPALQDGGGNARPQRFWWSMVAAAAVLLIAMLVVRDVERTRTLETLVVAHGDGAATARALRARVIAEDRRRRQWLAQRQRQNVLGMLAETTRVVPQRAWVQRLDWDGARLRLSGYKAGDVDIIASLRRSPLFAAVRPSNAEAAAPQPLGEPFDVTAELRR